MLTPVHNMQLNRKKAVKAMAKQTYTQNPSLCLLASALILLLPSQVSLPSFPWSAQHTGLCSCLLTAWMWPRTDTRAQFGTNKLLWEGLKGAWGSGTGSWNCPGWIKGATRRVRMCHWCRLEGFVTSLGEKTWEHVQIASNLSFLVKPATRDGCIYCTAHTSNKEKGYPQDTALY